MRIRLLLNNLTMRHGLKSLQSSFQNNRLLGTTSRFQNLASTSDGSSGFLRETYFCNAEWEKRLEDPILHNIKNIDELFYDIDKRYQADKVISAIDVDLYANKVVEAENLDELEELVHRLRRSPATADSLPSTNYAVIRAMLAAGKFDDLMRILNDRWNYGVFVDFHAANILMEEFLKQGNNRDAAKVASLLMLEENFGPPISRYFALVSCLAYLQNPTPEPWDTSPPPKEETDEDEEVKVRLRYIRNPYFDDHFDLTNPNHLVGKTLSLLGTHIAEDLVLATSTRLLGLALHEKWDQVQMLMEKCVKNKIHIAEEVVSKISELCEKSLASIEASPNKKLEKPKVHQFPGVNLDEPNLTKMWKQLNFTEQDQYVSNVKNLLASNKLSISKDLNMITKSKELLSSAVSEFGEQEAKNQSNTFEEWKQMRFLELDNQMKRFRKHEVIESIEVRKKNIQEKEETIFFFDNEEEWMMRLPPDEQQGYKLSTTYIPSNYEKFVRCVPPKKNIKKKKKE